MKRDRKRTVHNLLIRAAAFYMVCFSPIIFTRGSGAPSSAIEWLLSVAVAAVLTAWGLFTARLLRL